MGLFDFKLQNSSLEPSANSGNLLYSCLDLFLYIFFLKTQQNCKREVCLHLRRLQLHLSSRTPRGSTHSWDPHPCSVLPAAPPSRKLGVRSRRGGSLSEGLIMGGLLGSGDGEGVLGRRLVLACR